MTVKEWIEQFTGRMAAFAAAAEALMYVPSAPTPTTAEDVEALCGLQEQLGLGRHGADGGALHDAAAQWAEPITAAAQKTLDLLNRFLASVEAFLRSRAASDNEDSFTLLSLPSGVVGVEDGLALVYLQQPGCPQWIRHVLDYGQCLETRTASPWRGPRRHAPRSAARRSAPTRGMTPQP